MAKAAVGMEIHPGAVVAVQLRQGRRGPVLNGWAAESLPPGAVTPEGVAAPDVVREAADAALRKARANRTNVCLAFSSRYMDARELRLPPMPREDMRAAIGFELRQFFGGVDDEERLIDFDVIPGREPRPAAHSRDNRKDVLVVSVPKRQVYEYLAPLHEARIFPEIVDVGIFSLPHALPRGGGVAYLHLGPRMVHVLLLRNGVYEVSRHTELALENVTESRMLDGDDALETLVRWVAETLEFARVRRGAFAVGEFVQTVVLSGPVATVSGMASFLQQRVGLGVAPAIPVLGEGGPALPEAEAPAYALAAAMALRGLTEL